MVITMNKVLIKLYVPVIEQKYDIWIPTNRKTYKVILLIIKAIYELSGEYYIPTKMPFLWDKVTAIKYDVNLTIKQNNIKNGAELVLL